MASSSITSAPFTQAVVQAMRKLFPEELADKSFDNTGLLLEAPFDATRRQNNSVLLTVDLTRAVADEAIERRSSVVVAYHPIIFRGLKSLTLKDTQQQSLLRLAAAGISVYSPHTAVDCANGGLGDWLADIVTGTPVDGSEEEPCPTPASRSDEDPFTSTTTTLNTTHKRPVFMLQHHPSQLSLRERSLKLASQPHTRQPITPVSHPVHANAGMGRIIRLAHPTPLTDIIDRIGLGLGNPKGFPIAIPQRSHASDITIRSIALCAGSGGSLFAQMEKAGVDDVDLYFTGELSHHEALAAIEKGKSVICLFHSNTERGFLHGVLQAQLEREVRREWDELRVSERASSGQNRSVTDALNDASVEVLVSEVDRDPYGIMVSTSDL